MEEVKIRNSSMLEQTTMMVAGVDPTKVKRPPQRPLPGKPKRRGGSKSKRKQAAKSRAKNRSR